MCVGVFDQAFPGINFDAEKTAAELNFDDYESLGPVRVLEPATIVAMLAARLVRSAVNLQAGSSRAVLARNS